tara:strand:- start:222 stop:1601 length:1380 start_codon:yes stop_codon:yes gene_type:complete
MATYSSTNGIKLISTGDEAGTWGTSSNVNWQITDVAANGFVSIALAATTYTLPVDAQPSAAQDGHYKAIKFTGTPGGTCTVTLEQNDRARMYMLVNSTNQTIIVTQGSGANVTISAGDSAIVLANGAGSGAAVELFSSNDAQLATIAVTVADPSNVGNRYYIDGALQQTVEIKPSITYRFDQSDTSNAGHPLRFSATADGTHATPAGTEYTTGVVTVGTPGSAGAFTQITLEQDAPQTLYYYCSVHPLMGGTVLGAYSSALSGNTAATSTTLTDADRVVVNDDGTMVQAAMTDFTTYFESNIAALSGVTITDSALSGVTITDSELAGATVEKFTNDTASATGAVNFDCKTQAVYLNSANASGNVQLNFRGDGSTTFADIVPEGKSLTAVYALNNGSTPYYVSDVKIDGTSQLTSTKFFWAGGTQPSSGNASGMDVYAFTFFRRSASAWTIFADRTFYGT